VDWDFLLDEGETPQGSLAFWQPPRGRYLNYGRMVNSRAISKGLTFRPLAVTAKETLDWHRSRDKAAQDTLRAGLSRERETGLLRKWNSLRQDN
jgi:2'-hydroxyisoflavone reductase